MADTSTPEPIDTCEGCRKPIFETDRYHQCADGPCLCLDCAPMLSDVIAQYREILNAEEWNPGELDFDTREQMLEATMGLEADLAVNGDRKMV